MVLVPRSCLKFCDGFRSEAVCNNDGRPIQIFAREYLEWARKSSVQAAYVRCDGSRSNFNDVVQIVANTSSSEN
jgi:hypothetical protein